MKMLKGIAALWFAILGGLFITGVGLRLIPPNLFSVYVREGVSFGFGTATAIIIFLILLKNWILVKRR